MFYKTLGIIAILAVLLTGCAQRPGNGAVIATVNGDPIYLKDLKRELYIKVSQNPSLEVNQNTLNDLVDTLVKKRLIIQAAMAKKMVREERFVDTIKAFWEQTLIRDFIDYKNRDFERFVYVTDEEVKDRYRYLQREEGVTEPLEDIYSQVRDMVEQEKKTKALEDWLEKRKKKANIKINKRLVSDQIAK